MPLRNSTTHYGQLARVLHWSSVGLILVCVIYGTSIEVPPPGEDEAAQIARHSSFGLLFLAVMLMRFGWRLANPNPVLSYEIAAWQQRAAISLHWFIYALVVCQCGVGIAQLVAAGSSIAVFDISLVGPLPWQDAVVRDRLNDVHARLANVIYITVAIHVGAAAYHQVFGVQALESKAET